MGRALATNLNALGLYAVALVLAAAFAAQLMLDELPCPLCLLQRIQFAMLAVGPDRAAISHSNELRLMSCAPCRIRSKTIESPE